jgi:hypothetical protein
MASYSIILEPFLCLLTSQKVSEGIFQRKNDVLYTSKPTSEFLDFCDSVAAASILLGCGAVSLDN